MIETDRLLLRPMVAEDTDALLRIFGDPKVMATFDTEPFDRGQMEGWCGATSPIRTSTATASSR